MFKKKLLRTIEKSPEKHDHITSDAITQKNKNENKK